MTRYASRLTEADKDAMRRAIRTTLAEPFPDLHSWSSLLRVAAGAIGCTPADLRETELDWLAAAITAAEYVGTFPVTA